MRNGDEKANNWARPLAQTAGVDTGIQVGLRSAPPIRLAGRPTNKEMRQIKVP